jgi:mannose-1-phosphate guanylyltransferase
MKAVLLIGGEGTRLRPLTRNTVKAMVPILNKPFLEHMVSYLKAHGVDDIILALCYLPEHVERHFGDGSRYGVKLTYVMEEAPLGTAGAVKNAEAHLDDSFFVFNGDIFTDIDLRQMLSFHNDRGAKATIALTPVEDPSSYGVVETEDDGRVKRFVEKPPPGEATTNMINAGIYVLDREVLDDIPPNTRYMFEHDLYPQLLARGVPIYGFPSTGYWIDIGTPEKYLQVQCDLLQGKGTTVLYSEHRDREWSSQAAETFIHPTARIDGPVLVGSGCSIGPAVRITGPAVIGCGCRILDGATIEKAVLWQNVQVGKRANLEACILGDHTVIGDSSFVGRSSVIGDHMVLPQGSHLAPGTRVEPDTGI